MEEGEQTIREKETFPLNAEVNGTPFSVLFSHAVKLKSAQDAPLRSKFDSYPSFYQNSIFPHEAVINARGKGFKHRLNDAVNFKSLGNNAFQNKDFGEAMSYYEQALAVFTWISNTNPSWKNEGINDDFILEEKFQTDSKPERCQVEGFLVGCYT